jgi:hypothetical protein
MEVLTAAWLLALDCSFWTDSGHSTSSHGVVKNTFCLPNTIHGYSLEYKYSFSIRPFP